MKKSNTPASILARCRSKKKPSRKAISQAAAALGRLGGNVGGPARAEALSDERRSEIATHAANVRWHGKVSDSLDFRKIS